MTERGVPKTKPRPNSPTRSEARHPEGVETAAPKTTQRKRRSNPAPPKPGTKAPRVIAVANQKGGVGKSTTAVSLGAALAELDYRVLVVDLDPQGNASTGLGIRHEARQVSVYEVLAAEAEIGGAIVETPVPNLFAVPSTIDLAGAEIELVSQFSRELRLRKALEPLQDTGYDFVFLDCPPSLGLLTVNALAAAAELMVPIQCEYYALEGLGQLLRNVRLVQQNVNPSLRLTGIVMTMFDPRTKLSEQVVGEVRRFFGKLVYRTVIPRTVRLSEAPGFGQPITVYDSRSRGAECYRALAVEVASREASDEPLPTFEELPLVVAPPPERHPAAAPRPLVPERREEVSVAETLEPVGSEVEAAKVEEEPVPSSEEAGPAPEVEALVAVAGSIETSSERSGGPVGNGVTRAEQELARLRRQGGAEAEPSAAAGGWDEVGSSTAESRAEPVIADPLAGAVAASPHAANAESDSRRPSEPSGAPESDRGATGIAEPRKRWSLFRRGGSR